MRWKKFFRDFGGHIAAALGVLIAVVSLLQSQRALRLSEMQTEVTMSVPLSLSINDECLARIETWPDWAVLQSLEFWPSREGPDGHAAIHQRSEQIELQLIASEHAQRWYGEFIPSWGVANPERVFISCGRSEDRTCTPVSLARSNLIPLLAVYDFEVGGESRRIHKLMILTIKFVYYPTSETEISESPYFICESIIPVATFGSHEEAVVTLEQERQRIWASRGSWLVDGRIPPPTHSDVRD